MSNAQIDHETPCALGTQRYSSLMSNATAALIAAMTTIPADAAWAAYDFACTCESNGSSLADQEGAWLVAMDAWLELVRIKGDEAHQYADSCRTYAKRARNRLESRRGNVSKRDWV